MARRAYERLPSGVVGEGIGARLAREPIGGGKDWRWQLWALPPEEDRRPSAAHISLLGAADRPRSAGCARQIAALASGLTQRRTDFESEEAAGLEELGGRRFRKRVESIRERVQENASPLVIHPFRRQVLAWNYWVLFLICVTVLTVPYDAAFTDDDATSGWLAVRSIVPEVVLVADMVLQFFVAPLDPNTQMLVFNHLRVAKLYLTGRQLGADLLSVLPFGLLWQAITGGQAPVIFVRGCAFLKLFRLARVPRLLLMYRFKRALSYGSKTLLQSVALVVVVAHAMACFWGLLGRYANDSMSWMDMEHQNGPALRALEPSALYVACLYWATFTLTGIGYGDIVAHTNLERVVGVSCMLTGALTWAVVVANIISIVGIWSAADAAHEVRMDELEAMMEERQFADDLRMELREYFKKRSFHLDKFARLRETIQHMSPRLACRAVDALFGETFRRVWWMRSFADDLVVHGPLLVELAERFDCQLFCPAEPVSARQALVMVVRGTAILRGEGVVIGGSVWGEDMLLDNPRLRRSSSAMALTFLEVAFLHRADLDEVLKGFPLARRHVREHKRRLALMRGIIYAADQERERTAKKCAESMGVAHTASRLTTRKTEMLNALRVHGQDSPIDVGEPTTPLQRSLLRKAGMLASGTATPVSAAGLEGRMASMESQLASMARSLDRLTLTAKLSQVPHSAGYSSEEPLPNFFGSEAPWSMPPLPAVEEVVQDCFSPKQLVTPRTVQAFKNTEPSRNRG